MATSHNQDAPGTGPILPPDSYLTLAAAGAAELKVQRSRFLAAATPVCGADAAREAIAARARKHHDARHVCFAWRIGSPGAIQELRNDDGEPSGSGGEPILVEIRKAGLTQVLVTVVRYFGGVKLGTGGLARAYGGAAAAAIAEAPVREVKQGKVFDTRLPYQWQKTIQHLLDRHDGEIRDEEYGVEVCWRIWLPYSQCAGFAAGLREATAGQVTLQAVPEP